MSSSECIHNWYAFDSDAETVWERCSKCEAQRTIATFERHLNNAVAAVYANAGASAVLADLLKAMEILDVERTDREWVHWNSRGEIEWVGL